MHINDQWFLQVAYCTGKKIYSQPHQFSVMSFQSKPLEIIASEIDIELGFREVQREQNYHDSQSDQMSYDSINAFDIFKHKLDIKQENQVYKNISNNQNSESSNLFKNLIIKVENVRVKFADHIFSFKNFHYKIGCYISQVLIKMSQDTLKWDFEIVGLNCYTEMPNQVLYSTKRVKKFFLSVDPVLKIQYSQQFLIYQLSNCSITLDSDSIKCLKAFQESLNLKEYWKDLQGYKPLRRPLASSNHKNYSIKRKLIVRDWLHYVVWFVRIRKLKQQRALNIETQVKLNIQNLQITIDDGSQPLLELKISEFFYQMIDNQQSLTVQQLTLSQVLLETNVIVVKPTLKNNRKTGLLDSNQILTASGKHKGISQFNLRDGQKLNYTQSDSYQFQGNKIQVQKSLNETNQKVNSLTNLLNKKKSKNETNLEFVGFSKKIEPRFITLLQIKGDDKIGQFGVSLSSKYLKLGDLKSVDLRSEQLLKLTELLLKVIDMKLVVKDWIPEIYFRKYLRCVGTVIRGLVKKRSQQTKQSNSSSMNSDDDDLYTNSIGWSLKNVLLDRNFEWSFTIEKFTFRLFSFQTQIAEITQFQPYQLSAKVIGNQAEFRVGNGLVINCANGTSLVQSILNSINFQLQPILAIVSYDQNMAKLEQIIRSHLSIQNNLRCKQHQQANMQYQTLYNQLESEEYHWPHSNEKSFKHNQHQNPTQFATNYQAGAYRDRKIDQDLPVPNFANIQQNQMSVTMQNCFTKSSSSKLLQQPKTAYFTKLSKESKKPNMLQVTTSSGRNSLVERHSTIRVPSLKIESIAPRLPHQSILKQSLVAPRDNAH